jgi:hypothetical protein
LALRPYTSLKNKIRYNNSVIIRFLNQTDIKFIVKKILYILIFLSAGFSSSAQRLLLQNLTTFDDKRVHFGFTLGLNAFDFALSHYDVMGDNPNYSGYIGETVTDADGNTTTIKTTSKVRADVNTLIPGFTVGIVSSLRLSESFDLRFQPGLSFGERKLTYNIPVNDINNSEKTNSYSIKSTYLDFPLLIKYKSRRVNNQRPYIIGGYSWRVDVSKTGQEDLVRLKPFGTYIEAGVGWDSYLQFFKFSTEVKFSFGLNNILNSAPKDSQLQVYTDALRRITSNIFTLSFHFE